MEPLENQEIAIKKDTTTGTKARLAFSMMLLVVLTASAGGGESAYVLDWSTIDGGGGTSSGGPYTLTGTIGQPDAAYSTGGSYELLGGFWPGGPLCVVDFHRFARFAEHWLEKPCNPGNDWCSGADLEPDGDVDRADLKLFVYQWLNYCPYDWRLK
ncbi:MAG: hypothetical protein ACYS6W_11830 [Planctomycetota bacterium]|jgi:hypothetical protein